MLSKLTKNKISKLSIILYILFTSNVKGASTHIEQLFPDIETNISSPLLPLPKSRVKHNDNSVAESLDLFKVSCDGIKYTGALEQVAITGLEQTREALIKMIMPYTSLSGFEAALFVASFIECLVTVSTEEVKGGEATESATNDATRAIGKARTGVVTKAGATLGSASAGGVVDVDFFPDIAGTLSAFLKSKVNNGWFDAVMDCTQEKRIQNYQKIYEFFNEQFTLKLNYEKMSFSQCNIELIKEGEEVPSWNTMFGNKISEYTNDFLDELNDNEMFDSEVNMKDICTDPDPANCPEGKYTRDEYKIKQKIVGDNIEIKTSMMKEDANGNMVSMTPEEQLDLMYPANEGFSRTKNTDGSYTVTKQYASVGAGDKARHIPALNRLQREWDAEQEEIKNKQEVANSGVVSNKATEVSVNINPANECQNGISSIGADDCLTYEQAQDYRRNMVRTTPTTMADFVSVLELSNFEKTAFEIMNQNPYGFAETLEYVYDKLRLINHKYTIAVKNTATGKEDLNYAETFILSYKDNFKLETTSDVRVIDIEEIYLQDQSGNKILKPNPFARALLKRIVLEVTSKNIPLNKKLSDSDFQKVLEIYSAHRNNYQKYIDMNFLLAKNIKAIDGSPINVDIFTENFDELLTELEKYLQQQRLAIKAMFVETGIIKKTDGTIETATPSSNSEVGIADLQVGMNKKDYRQEIIKLVNQHIIEYKLSGEAGKIKSIQYFYKMFLFLKPTSLADKMAQSEEILNDTTMAKEYVKREQLMHGIVLENILLEKAKNFKIIEKHIDKRK